MPDDAAAMLRPLLWDSDSIDALHAGSSIAQRVGAHTLIYGVGNRKTQDLIAQELSFAADNADSPADRRHFYLLSGEAAWAVSSANAAYLFGTPAPRLRQIAQYSRYSLCIEHPAMIKTVLWREGKKIALPQKLKRLTISLYSSHSDIALAPHTPSFSWRKMTSKVPRQAEGRDVLWIDAPAMVVHSEMDVEAAGEDGQQPPATSVPFPALVESIMCDWCSEGQPFPHPSIEYSESGKAAGDRRLYKYSGENAPLRCLRAGLAKRDETILVGWQSDIDSPTATRIDATSLPALQAILQATQPSSTFVIRPKVFWVIANPQQPVAEFHAQIDGLSIGLARLGRVQVKSRSEGDGTQQGGGRGMHPLAVCARGLPTTMDAAQALAWWKTISGFDGEWPAPLRAEIVRADKINEVIFYFDSQQARNTVMAVRELEYASPTVQGNFEVVTFSPLRSGTILRPTAVVQEVSINGSSMQIARFTNMDLAGLKTALTQNLRAHGGAQTNTGTICYLASEPPLRAWAGMNGFAWQELPDLHHIMQTAIRIVPGSPPNAVRITLFTNNEESMPRVQMPPAVLRATPTMLTITLGASRLMHVADADTSVLTPTGTILRYDGNAMALSTARGRDDDALRLELLFFQFGEGAFLSTTRTRAAPSRGATQTEATPTPNQASPSLPPSTKQTPQKSTPPFQRRARARGEAGLDSGVK